MKFGGRVSVRFVSVMAVLALAAGAGCSSRSGSVPAGDGGVGPRRDAGTIGAGLRIEPADYDATITGGAPVVVDYRAIVRDASGADMDVTASVAWSSTVPALGSFSGSTFTSAIDRGGVTSIRATMGALSAFTTLTLHLDRTIITPGTPADAPSRFGGTPDPTRAPDLVYPEDATMVPPNLGKLEFHYRTGGNTVFELTFTTPTVNLRVYFGCPEMVAGGCIYEPDADVWDAISTGARGQGPITYRLRGADAAGHMGEASERTLIVAQEDVTGGLYYWAATRGTVMRFEFGVRGAREEAYMDTARTGALMCVGCHVLSRDGQRFGVGTDTPTSTFQVFDVATRTKIFQNGTGAGFPPHPTEPNFSSFAPDASQIVQSFAAGLRIIDGNSGAVILEGLGGGPSTMPDWSPDGQHVVYVRHNQTGGGPFALVDYTGIVDGRIVRLDWDGASWAVGPTLAESPGENLYYPAYSPDGQWVVYDRSPSNTSSVGDDPASGMSGVRDSELWLVSSSGGPPRQLTNIAGLMDSWAKFDPTEYMDSGHPLYWMAWSSRRAYGLRLASDTRMQLWMAAFDPTAAEAGLPTHPAFWLPFQNIESGNHIPQWVTHIERETCTTDMDCGGEFCVAGRCYEQTPLF